MANRQIYNSASSPPVTGPAYMDQIAAHLKKLYDAAGFPLTAIGGTANAVTATLDPTLDGSGLVEGMRFGITWAAANTAGVTLALNGGSAVAVLDATGAALIAGAVASGARGLLEYVAGSFRLIAGGVGTGMAVAHYYQAFTASGTWTKPGGLDDDTLVTIEAWGGGGGGGKGSASGTGGAGGAYVRALYRLVDLPSSMSVTIGAGGIGATSGNGTVGGNTTVGSLLTAYGGGYGMASGAGGDGGGAFSAGFGGTPGLGGGYGNDASRSDAIWPTGGGSGGRGTIAPVGGGGGAAATPGGSSMHGGGGGGARAENTAGGLSLFGGHGGAGATGTGVAGSAPAGGGGAGSITGGAGARGEMRIWL